MNIKYWYSWPGCTYINISNNIHFSDFEYTQIDNRQPIPANDLYSIAHMKVRTSNTAHNIPYIIIVVGYNIFFQVE